MEFKVLFCLCWSTRNSDGNFELAGQLLYESSGLVNIPFYPQHRDQIKCGGKTGEVTSIEWDCDTNTGEVGLYRHLNSEQACREYGSHFMEQGWIDHNDESDNECAVSGHGATQTPSATIAVTPTGDPPFALDFGKIAAIMRDTQKVSSILRDAMSDVEEDT